MRPDAAPRAARALVVGGGFGGLAAALRLRARGFAVTVVERAPMLGGRAQVYQRDGYVYDAGPTVITAPFLLEELFALFDKRLEDYVTLRPIEPWYRFRFPDGREFNYGGTLDDTLGEIARFNPADRDGYRRLVDVSRRIYDVGFTQLAHRPVHRLGSMLKVAPSMARLRSYRTVYGLVSSYISHPYLRQAFSVQPLLIGGNPFDTTSIYMLIHYLERRWGIHYALGGTGSIVRGLAKLMDEQGIAVRLGETVDEILIERGRAVGARLVDNTILRADIIVVNGDPPFVYRHLIPARYRRTWTDRRIERLRYSMGLFVLYFGTTHCYDNVAHHTIALGDRYRDLMRAIFHRQVLTDDISLYLHRPTATDPSLAPPGGDSFYALVPVPNLQSAVDWTVAGPRYRDRVIATLEKTLLPELRQHLAHDFYVTPNDFRERFLSHWGTGFSIAPVLSQSAYFRFHNRAEDIADLFFVGAGTHPGAGLPGVLSSAKVLDQLLAERGPVVTGDLAPLGPRLAARGVYR